MIPAKLQYKTNNNKFLAIIEVSKTWKYYFKSYKHKIYILTDYNNLKYFIDINSLSFK